MTSARGTSASARLARVGFSEPGRAAAALESPTLAPVLADEEVLSALAVVADPDAALGALGGLLEAAGDADRKSVV